MRRGRIARSGMPASPTASSFRRSRAIPARCSGRSPTSSRSGSVPTPRRLLQPFGTAIRRRISSPCKVLEEKVVKLRPPPWPKAIFGFDERLAKQGEALFEERCKGCHSSEQPSLIGAWSTPVKAVGTDPKMVVEAERMVDPGILRGSIIPMLPIGARLEHRSKALDVLAVAIIGTMFEQAQLDNAERQEQGLWRALRQDMLQVVPEQRIDLSKITQEKIDQIREFITA